MAEEQDKNKRIRPRERARGQKRGFKSGVRLDTNYVRNHSDSAIDRKKTQRRKGKYYPNKKK